MAIDKDFINDIRAEIGEYIAAQSADIFPAVYAYPKTSLEAYPAVVIMPSENVSDYGDTENNRFALAFNLIVYYPVSEASEQEDVELAVGEAVGELIRIFSVRNPLTTCEWVTPVPSVWGDAEVGNGIFRTALVTLRCIKYMTVR